MSKQPNPFAIGPLADPQRKVELESAALDERARAAGQKPPAGQALLERLLGKPQKKRPSRIRQLVERELRKPRQAAAKPGSADQ